MNSNAKGAIAETQIAAAAVKLGVPVLRPVTEHGRYDLVFEIGSRLLRVQCKWATLDTTGSVVVVHVGGSYCTPTGYVRSTYAAHEVDLVAAYCDALGQCYLLPISLVAEKSVLHLRVGRRSMDSVHALPLRQITSSLGL